MTSRVTVGADYFTRWAAPDAAGCLIWQGHITKGGYGRATTRPIRYAHRVAYETFIDEIPPGFEVDHLCSTPSCINPFHLEVVTTAENGRRIAERRTHCKHNHLFDERNTRRRPDGSRACRACERERGRRRSTSPSMEKAS